VAQASKAKSDAELRAEIMAPQVRRGAWIQIAGPLSALFIGAFAAWFYLKPIGVLRWLQQTRLSWSGVAQTEVALDAGLMSYYYTGGFANQEPIVLVHGLGPNAALVWRSVMSPIAAGHYKVVAPNLMGFAESDHKQENYSIAYQAKALGQLIERLELTRVNLVGQDLGADVALYYAVTHPENVERLVLVAGGLQGARGAAKLKSGLLPDTPEKMREQIEMTMFWLPPLPEFMYDRMMVAVADDLPAQHSMLNSVGRDEGHIRARMSEIFNTLTIVVWGGKDPYFTRGQGEALSAMMPGSATTVFQTSGHYPQLEHPEEFADTMLYLLKQTQGGK
jgi:pimeloyl-ACP methyl ester carboxylesterase